MYQRPSCVDDAELSPLVLCARSWSSIPSTPTSYTVNVGDKLQFSYSAAHNVYLMASESAYDICDFAGATELAGVSHGGGSGSTPNVYEAVATADEQAVAVHHRLAHDRTDASGATGGHRVHHLVLYVDSGNIGGRRSSEDVDGFHKCRPVFATNRCQAGTSLLHLV